MLPCDNCGMESDGYLICRRPVVWKKRIIICGLDRSLKQFNHPPEDSPQFKKIVSVIKKLSELKC
jgi:hypothetical protein